MVVSGHHKLNFSVSLRPRRHHTPGKYYPVMIVFAWRMMPTNIRDSSGSLGLRILFAFLSLFFSHPTQDRFRIPVLISNDCLPVYWLICNSQLYLRHCILLYFTLFYPFFFFFFFYPIPAYRVGEILARGKNQLPDHRSQQLETLLLFKLLLRGYSVQEAKPDCGITSPSESTLCLLLSISILPPSIRLWPYPFPRHVLAPSG